MEGVGPAGVPNHDLRRTKPPPRWRHPRETLQYPPPPRGVAGATAQGCEAAERGPSGPHTRCRPATLARCPRPRGRRARPAALNGTAELRTRPHLRGRRGPAPFLRKGRACHSNRRGKSRPSRRPLDRARRPPRLIGRLPAGRCAGPWGAGSTGVATERRCCADPKPGVWQLNIVLT